MIQWDNKKALEQIERAVSSAYESNLAWQQFLLYVQKLERQVDFLAALEAAGVDNWSGYDEALDMVKGE